MDEPGRPVSTDEVMREIGGRVSQRLRSRLAELQTDSPLVSPEVFNETEALLRRAAETRRSPLLPALVVDDDWQLRTSLNLRSHRWYGRLIVGAKERVLLPLTRWLFEYSRDNFARQQRVNDMLASCVETLAVEVVLLRRELERRRTPGGGAGPTA